MDLLTLEKQNTILNGIEFVEYLPKQRIQALIASGVLLLDWAEKFTIDINKEKVREHYSNEVQQVRAYLKNYNVVLGGVKVKYSRYRASYGRVYSVSHYGFTPFRKVVRNSLILDLYYDFDLRNAHQSITVALCEKANIHCPILKTYVADRDRIIKNVCDYYGVDEDDAKDLFIRLNFGGKFETWVTDYKVQKVTPLDFVVSYQREIKDIAEKIKSVNKPLWEVIKGRKIKDEEALRSFFATYLQEWEVRIVSYSLNYLIHSTSFLKHPTNPNCLYPVGSYEYDGFKLLKENVDKNGGIQAVLDIIHQKTTEFGFPSLKWICKEMKEFIDLNEWVSQVVDSECEDTEFKLVCDKLERLVKRKDTGIVEFINEMYPNHFVYSLRKGDSANQGNWFCWDGNRWRSNNLPLRNAITYDIEKKVEEMLLPFSHYKFEPIDEDDEPNANQKLHQRVTEVQDSIISRITNANDVNNAITQARQIFANYTLEFDIKPYLLGFENGVLDIETKTFRAYSFDDKVSFSCGYDFVPYNSKLNILDKDGNPVPTPFVKNELDDKAYKRIDDFFKEIQPNPEERKFVKIIQASGLVGIPIQLFNIYNGCGRNGKGIVDDFTDDALGDYSVKVSSSVFAEIRKSSGNSNPEIAKIDKKRFVYTREPPKDVPIQNAIAKDLTGGGTYEARMNYSNNSVVNLFLTLVMECNVKPDFAEQPENAETERIRDVLFRSRFTDDLEEVDGVNVFLKDNQLAETFKKVEYKVALINYLLDDLFDLHQAEYNVSLFTPDSISVRSLVYLNKSNDTNKLFEEVFELRQEGVEYIDKEGNVFDEDWTLPAIAGIIRSCRTSFHTLSKKKKESLTKEVITEFFLNNKIYKKLIIDDKKNKTLKLKGYRLRKPEIDEDGMN